MNSRSLIPFPRLATLLLLGVAIASTKPIAAQLLALPEISVREGTSTQYSTAQTALIDTPTPRTPAQASRPLAQTPMRVWKITSAEDSILLRTPSEPIDVQANDAATLLLAERMFATVRDSMSLGVGIAAPQVGILKRMILCQRFDKVKEGLPFEVYLNPVIRQYTDKKQECREGCLSIPNRRDTLNSRAYAILIEYDRLDGTHEIEMVEAFTAVVFQHEIDHLNGILYLDHLAEERKAAGPEPREGE